MRKKFTLFIFISFIFLSRMLAQVNISVGNPPSNIIFTGFDGSGFAASPSAGQLDSDEWRIEGLSDGDGTWGGTHTAGDYTRGSSSGAVGTGGIYAFDVGSSNIALGFQTGTADMTPGKLILRLVNTGSDPITQLDISYKIWEFNDQDRSSSLNFAYGEGSSEPESFTAVGALDYTTTEAGAPSPTWVSTNRSTTITGLNVSQNQFIYLVWETADVGGSGSRDEIAIDDIAFTNVVPVELTIFTVSVQNNNIKLKWETATEVNNYGFEIEKTIGKNNWDKIGFVQGHGTTNFPMSYSFFDNDITLAGTYYYRLKQIDIDGTYEYSPEVEANVGAPAKYNLGQNFPNPFNPTTNIQFSLPESGNVKLTVFNSLGEKVITLVNSFINAGYHTIKFNAESLPSGIYIYKLESANYFNTKKMIYLK